MGTFLLLFFAHNKETEMDDDIRANLKELGDHLTAVARQISSTKSNLEGMTAMSETLALAKDTLDTYIHMQADRYAKVD
jgi:hypothetical protein